jgi:uracil phosphoribosyltransferase
MADRLPGCAPYRPLVPLTVVDHPLVSDRVARLRATSTASAEFRRITAELSTFLAYEAARSLPVTETMVRTPLGVDAPARTLPERVPLLVPILRAGLGLLDGVLAAIPSAEVGLVGLARDEESHEPTPYCLRLPAELPQGAFVLDPMLATGGSMVYTCRLLQERGVRDIAALCLLAAPEGVAKVEAELPDVHIVTAALDERLNDAAFIVPGLGDAGDRLYGRV